MAFGYLRAIPFSGTSRLIRRFGVRRAVLEVGHANDAGPFSQPPMPKISCRVDFVQVPCVLALPKIIMCVGTNITTNLPSSLDHHSATNHPDSLSLQTVEQKTCIRAVFHASYIRIACGG